MEKYICPICKKEFEKRVYKKCHAVYCSQECAYKGRSLGYSKRIVKVPYNCKRKEPKNCEICQKEFIYRKKTQRFCSKECYRVAQKEMLLGKKNPSWLDGRSYKKRCYRGNDWETLRQEVYKRDNYICQDCGVKCESKSDCKNTDNIIQCHHIENYKTNKNNNLNNLITLCLKCHLTRHKAKGQRVG